MDGCVFNIERFAIHDGPGIRTVVFLKGCNLRCRWCSNPESQDMRFELMHSAKKCLGPIVCGQCAKACKYGAVTVENAMLRIRKDLCRRCGACVRSCPSGAMEMAGSLMSDDELIDQLVLEAPFYRHSGGGVTFSGGEPLLQSEFVLSACKKCEENGISTAVETTGNVPWQILESVAPHVRVFLYDVKHMNCLVHKQQTAVGNERILENLVKLNEAFPDSYVIARTPVIPGFNNSEEDIRNIASFLSGLSVVKEYTLLPFHSFGASKYDSLGRLYDVDVDERISEEQMQILYAAAELQQYR